MSKTPKRLEIWLEAFGLSLEEGPTLKKAYHIIQKAAFDLVSMQMSHIGARSHLGHRNDSYTDIDLRDIRAGCQKRTAVDVLHRREGFSQLGV